MEALLERALTDLATLEQAGFDAVLVENDNDQPHQIGVSPEIRSAFTEIMRTIIAHAQIPAGMEIIYDMPATVAVAHDVGAPFVRLDVFADTVETRYGTVPASAEETINLRRTLGADNLFILTDVHVKHAKLLSPKTLHESTTESFALGSDGLIITGDWTGNPPTITDLQQAQTAAQDAPIIIGSGLTTANALTLLTHADAAIVGTSIKSGDYVDHTKAAELVAIVNTMRGAR
jgi:membrane complex biogenesis BtpA family protein